MGVFEGDVTVVAGDAEHAARAVLRSWTGQPEDVASDAVPGMSEDVPAALAADWNGTLEVADADVVEGIMGADAPHLRLPDGRVGDFTVAHRYIGTTHLMIEGSGRPPF
ncbi:hypothetical protein ACH46N_29080 [Streptomyces pristinaespiralis]|jgi:hypothetical protein|uniref:Uncharacterized protein n=2 Tax=Streptomyces pristinaespiralis TaxID=38300 RepID=B5HD52_STRE2|nr:hypothetical protein [Streptomyces pristinaespiralis]ALC25256.1 hypothetical protein SPRI_6950 [Streptomyces pristinaespiralis]EDY64763.1 conserved hypothetical protein [Streptomyces pristinaespiralis ATCC 25486]QMU12509.1 hypothetical protein H3L99_02035 [Streptomyces pristinaespiralis]